MARPWEANQNQQTPAVAMSRRECTSCFNRSALRATRRERHAASTPPRRVVRGATRCNESRETPPRPAANGRDVGKPTPIFPRSAANYFLFNQLEGLALARA